MTPEMIDSINRLTTAIETQNGIAEALMQFCLLIDKEIKEIGERITNLRDNNDLTEM